MVSADVLTLGNRTPVGMHHLVSSEVVARGHRPLPKLIVVCQIRGIGEGDIVGGVLKVFAEIEIRGMGPEPVAGEARMVYVLSVAVDIGLGMIVKLYPGLAPGRAAIPLLVVERGGHSVLTGV